MTKSSKQELKTKAAYNARPENVRKRVLNNAARRAAIKAGTVHVGDGTNIDHKKPLDKGGGNDPSNLRVLPEGENKGWRGRQPEMYSRGKK
jgi:hypothetical protein